MLYPSSHFSCSTCDSPSISPGSFVAPSITAPSIAASNLASSTIVPPRLNSPSLNSSSLNSTSLFSPVATSPPTNTSSPCSIQHRTPPPTFTSSPHFHLSPVSASPVLTHPHTPTSSPPVVTLTTPVPGVPRSSMKPKRKRKCISIQNKQAALTKLGVNPDGTFGTALLNNISGKPYLLKEIANEFGVSSGSVIGWKKNAKTIMNPPPLYNSLGSSMRIRQAAMPMLEDHLFNLYFKPYISEHGPPPQWVYHDLHRRTKQVRLTLMHDLTWKLQDPSLDHVHRERLSKELNTLQNFQISQMWLRKFLRRYNLVDRTTSLL